MCELYLKDKPTITLTGVAKGAQGAMPPPPLIGE